MRKNKLQQLQKLEDLVEPKAELVKKSICSREYCFYALRTVGLVLFYYTFSIGLTLYNKKVFTLFHFALSVTVFHLTFKFVMASIIRKLVECKTGKDRVMLSWGVYLKRVAPAGIASALDIGLSNWGMEFITVTLYTMVKSTAIIFILTFSILMKLEKCRFSLVFVVLFISVGLVLFTFHSTQFNWTGFLLVLTAAFTSGFRWTLSQVVTQKSEIGLSNPLDMMYHIQPWMIIGLLPLSSYVEGVPLASSHHLFRFHEISEILTSVGIVIGGAFLAFMLEFSEFLLLSRTSGLTLSISGIFKEICTIVLAHITFGDKMNPINFLGLVICLFGIALHVILKAVHRKEDEKELHNNSESMEMLLVNGEANSTDEEEAELFDRNAVRPPRVHKHSE